MNIYIFKVQTNGEIFRQCIFKGSSQTKKLHYCLCFWSLVFIQRNEWANSGRIMYLSILFPKMFVHFFLCSLWVAKTYQVIKGQTLVKNRQIKKFIHMRKCVQCLDKHDFCQSITRNSITSKVDVSNNFDILFSEIVYKRLSKI